MSSQSPHTWGSAINDFFDHAISTSSLDHHTANLLSDPPSRCARPVPSKYGSSDTMASHDSGFHSLSPDVPVSPLLDPSDVGQDSHMNGKMQLIWSAEEANSFAHSRAGLLDQHHEKSCARCSLTDADARMCRLNRRREQNRESQRKFRARKEAKIREAAGQVAALESYVEFLEKHNHDLEAVNVNLQQQIASHIDDGHVCTVEVGESASKGIHVMDSAIWGPRTSSTVISTLTEEPSSVNVTDMHLSLFDHELLPPYNPKVGHH